MTRRTLSRAVAVMLAAQAIAGCAALQAHVAGGSLPARAWPSTLDEAQDSARVGRFDVADSLLADYAKRFPGTSEALETAYWRALLQVDPANKHSSLTLAMASLDAYLADQRPRAHVEEAMVVRRVAGQLDAMNRLAANAMSQAKDATATAHDAKAQAADARADAARAAGDTPPTAEAEIRRLKDELAKANAELERIRKRLAQPPGKP